MTRGMRWRILTLQAVLFLILGLGAGLMFWAATFTQGYVHDELVAQQITFPTTDSAGFTALPQADQDAMRPYAGQQMTNGDQAKVYANNFINVHLHEIGGGKTYSQFPASGLTPQQQATKTTLFQGETLRGLLLNAWGWWTVGTIALYAAIGMAVAALIVVFAFFFEAIIAPRRQHPEAVEIAARPTAPRERTAAR